MNVAPVLGRKPWLSLEITAATLIQAYFRGMAVRRRFNGLRVFYPGRLPNLNKKTFLDHFRDFLTWEKSLPLRSTMNWAEKEAFDAANNAKKRGSAVNKKEPLGSSTSWLGGGGNGSMTNISRDEVGILGKDGILFGDH
ncbi:hypothetical protein TrLO_g5218 [Triparma laevis f. longispina]|uniref:Uncharacterized protein n=1 Tax=Triparma laevis f. longispina TaxID=1714387 RepID=A0A9W7A3H2_9STRA|nr:hypothetical protein TrLO_g5218 [Triparma laevis f. longispina]